MTWTYLAVPSRAVLAGRLAAVLSVAALALFGCSSDSKTATIVIEAPADDALLTLADDTDPGRDGLQVTVSGKSSGVKATTMLAVYVDDSATGAEGAVGPSGNFTIEDVTLPPGTHDLAVRTLTGSVSSAADHSYTFKGLVIASPEDGALLRVEDDEDLDQAGIQISVTVDSFAIELTEDITLSVDDTEVGSEAPDADGQAVFDGITLISGSHRLRAASGSGSDRIQSDEVMVTVREGCAAVTFTQPAVPMGASSIMLGGGDACPTGSEPYTTTVAISTDAGNGRPTQLFVNGQPVASGTVQGAAVVFDDVPLTKLNTANTIAVEVENSEGVTCREELGVDVMVDCAGPDCSLASPVPVSYTDDGGDTTLFLNASHRDTDGFEFVVETSSEAVGHAVSLIIDGDERDAFTADAEAAGSAAEAVFQGVALAEGSHTVEARCVDGAGNESFSGELTWVVDTAACLVDITDPVADAVLVPADDTDATADGTQIVLSSSVSGGDCIAQRAAGCDSSSGISGTDFVPYDGAQPLLASVELDASTQDQTLCVEVQDEAGNVGRASVDVTFLGAAPMVEIESPADGVEFNKMGNGGANRVMDADAATPGCQADFSVACTELGTVVELHHDSATGDVFGMAECMAPGSGDPALPSGFDGRATVRTGFSDGDAIAVVVATQTVAGSSGQMLVGESAAITIEGDCDAPVPSFQNNACNDPNNFLGVASATDDYIATVSVIAGAPDVVSASLNVNHSVDGSRDVAPDSANSRTFTDVNYGGVGDVTLTATVVDGYDNSASVACSATIASDVPSLTLTAPTDQAAFGPRAAIADTCDTGNAGEYGVLVTATVDKRNGRDVSISVEGSSSAVDLSGSDASVDLSACNADPEMPCTFSMCVAMQDDYLTSGGSDIVVRADSTSTSAFDSGAATIHVTTVAFIGPTDNQVFGSGATDCAAGGGFDAQVQLQVDPMHNGENWRVSHGAGMVNGVIVNQTTVGDCLAMPQGPSTLTAVVGADDITRSIGVTVATLAPTNEVVLTPTCPDSGSASFRDDPVHIDWDDLANLEDWTGQFQDYVLKCASTPAADAATPDDWWNNDAVEVALPPAVTPASGTTAADLSVRLGERRHCALRASDAGGLMTPITGSTDLTCQFRQVLLWDSNVASANFGRLAAAVGDVNGDDVDDILVGARGNAYLFMGSLAGPPAAPDVTFIASGSLTIAGLGDFNGDGENDFAIAQPTWNGNAGQVFVFFGRPQDDWPTSINLTTSTCGADVCLKHSTGAAILGLTLTHAGDFNADGFDDLFVSARNVNAGTGQAFVVLGDNYEQRACTGAADCRSNETCGASSTCELSSGLFWGLDYELPSANWLNPPSGTPELGLKAFQLNGDNTLHAAFGGILSALGDLDMATGNNAGDDLVIGSVGSTGLPASRLYFLSGRAYTLGVGAQVLAVPGELGFRDASTGTPSGTPFEDQPVRNFGLGLVAVGNVYDAPNLSGDVVDLLVKDANNSQYAYVYPGEAQFDRGERVRIEAPNATEIGISAAKGFNPGLPAHASFPAPSQDLLGDVDGDGIVDLCLGSVRANRPEGSATYASPGGVYLWYADHLAMSFVPDHVAPDPDPDPNNAGSVDHLSGSRIEPATSADTLNRIVQYIGDINDDGHPDLFVGDPQADSGEGRASVLY